MNPWHVITVFLAISRVNQASPAAQSAFAGPLLDGPTWSVEGTQGGDASAPPVAAAGDVDRDGFDDLLVGAYGYDAGATDTGKAWLFRGGPQGPVVQASRSFVFSSPGLFAPPDHALQRYSADSATALGAGDVDGDGDGRDDIAIGIPTPNGGGILGVFHGRP